MGNLPKLIEVADRYGVPYLVTDDPAMPMFQTTYTNDCLHTCSPARLDKQLELTIKREAAFYVKPTVDAATNYLFWLPRSHRFQALDTLLDALEGANDHDLAELILHTYIDTEIFDADYAKAWRDLLAEHSTILQIHTLPFHPDQYRDSDELVLYHGVEYSDDDYQANAWTLDHAIALKFARRFAKPSNYREIWVTTMPYRQVIRQAAFYTDHRSESEVYFVDPPEQSSVRVL